jgi:predicted phage terminase large subunit-like protein
VQPSDLAEIALRQGFTKAQVDSALRGLNDEQVTRLGWMAGWVDTRHEHQIEPDGDWLVWLILGGRGAGKTRVGAEWLGMRAALRGRDSKGKTYRGLVAAPTKGDLREVCIEGDSGLLSVIPGSLVADYNKNNNKIVLHNGSILGGIAAETATRFRGPQWHDAWGDELAAWGDNGRDPQDAWDTMAMSVRLGDDSRILATTTPRPKPHIKALIADPGTVVTTASTYVNLDNLNKKFAQRILKYEGTLIGRQEIHAELIDAEEGGIIKRADLRMWPNKTPLPKFEYIVMSLDTAYSEEAYDKRKQTTDPTACTVWGGFKYKGLANIMLLDSWAERLGFPDLVDRITAEKDVKYGESDKRPYIAIPKKQPQKVMGIGKGIDVILIEEKASGKSLRQQLYKDGILTQGFNPGAAGKLTRLHIVSPLPHDGRIWIPESTKKPGAFMSWAEPLLEQLCAYHGEGTTLNDDYVDSTTQAWRLLDDTWLHYLDVAKKKKDKKIIDTEAPARKRPSNPYGQ